MKKAGALLHEIRALGPVFILLFFLTALFLLSNASNSEAVEDTIPPTGSVLINDGAPTNNSSVVLTLSATDDIGSVTSMQLSNDGVSWDPSEPYTATKNWTLASGEGTKTVFVRFCDNAGNWSPLPGFSATIILDVTPPAVSSFAKVAAGNNYTVAVKTDGSLWAWGDNANGQLGDGSTLTRYSPVKIGNATWSGLSAGNSHTVALRTDGTLWAWGANESGQLGDGSTTDHRIAPAYVGLEDDRWIAVSAGANHTVAIKSDGTLWGWGSNSSGQVGETPDNKTPNQIGSVNTWIAAAAGGNHTAALKSDGTIWGWGNNTYGQLGTGPAPFKISADNGWIAIAAGANHTVALRNDGSLWSWGHNAQGQLGDGTNTSSGAGVGVVQTLAGTDDVWASVACRLNSTFAIRSDGTLWSWGNNNYGQLGDGSMMKSKTPVHIDGTGWAAVVSGGYHSLGVKSNGTLWSWGHSGHGQLGRGPVPNKYTPTEVSSGWSKIAAGNYHSVGIKTDRTLWTWGDNSYGQLGTGTIVDKNAPINIGTDSTWVEVSAGINYTVALKTRV